MTVKQKARLILSVVFFTAIICGAFAYSSHSSDPFCTDVYTKSTSTAQVCDVEVDVTFMPGGAFITRTPATFVKGAKCTEWFNLYHCD